MALKESHMVKTVLSNTVLELSPDTGESIRVTNVSILPYAAVTEFATVQINRQTVGYYHIGSGVLNQLPLITGSQSMKTVIRQGIDSGLDMSYPVAEGETFRVITPHTSPVIMVEYELYDASDVKSNDVNGSTSTEYYYCNYGTNTSALASNDYVVLTGSHNPAEFPDFPFGAIVPAGCTIDIVGIGIADITRTGATPATDYRSTGWLRLFRDRRVLFDEDRNGLYVHGATSGTTASTTYYGIGNSTLPYGGSGTYTAFRMLPSPLEFKAGEELSVQLSTISGGTAPSIAANAVYLCMLLHVKQG